MDRSVHRWKEHTTTAPATVNAIAISLQLTQLDNTAMSGLTTIPFTGFSSMFGSSLSNVVFSSAWMRLSTGWRSHHHPRASTRSRRTLNLSRHFNSLSLAVSSTNKSRGRTKEASGYRHKMKDTTFVSFRQTITRHQCFILTAPGCQTALAAALSCAAKSHQTSIAACPRSRIQQCRRRYSLRQDAFGLSLLFARSIRLGSVSPDAPKHSLPGFR